MSELHEYKCPQCDGAITFDSRLQKMKCPYCATEFDPETLAAYKEELEKEKGLKGDDLTWQKNAGTQWDQNEESDLLVYTCNTCGGEIVAEETTAATSCPYCSNPVIMKSRLSGSLKPDYVIPFKIDKKQAVEILNRHYKGKRFLPKVFKSQNHIEEVKGIYVPYWLFDTDVDAHFRYKAHKNRVWSDSRYNYCETSVYSVVREGNMSFDRIPVDGSSKMDDALMESIEPFDFSQAVDFRSAYLAGYLADKYDIDDKQSTERANSRIRKSTTDAFDSTVTGFTFRSVESSNIQFRNSSAKYALYPVWLLNTDWKGKKYTFAINGQSGKIAGDLPLDKGAFFRFAFLLSVGISAAAFAISYLSWLM